QFLSDQQGYTQGLGLSYEVDFDNFKELMGKIFKKRPKEEKIIEPVSESNAVMGKDSLIQFFPKTKNLRELP
ncbi:MAG: hypothetical protein AAFZ89_10550, partial [Bacteroidota bacterium]